MIRYLLMPFAWIIYRLYLIGNSEFGIQYFSLFEMNTNEFEYYRKVYTKDIRNFGLNKATEMAKIVKLDKATGQFVAITFTV